MHFADQIALLFDHTIWSDNPVAMRDFRRESRLNRLFYAIVTLVSAVLVVCALGGANIYTSLTIFWHVSSSLGGDPATALAIAVSGLHFWWVARAAQQRIDGMLMREAALDGMTSLLMLPTNRLVLVLQSAVYPWLAAAGIALLLLPIYAFCVSVGAMSITELFALYLIFALLAVVAPSFRRPALSGNIAVSMLNQTVEDPSAEPEAGRSLLQKRGVKSTVAPIGMIIAIPAFLIFLAVTALTGNSYTSTYIRYVPMSILSLLPSIYISLPMILTRAIVYPFLWFHMAVPPLFFVVPLVLAKRYLDLMRTGEFLSVGQYKDLATAPGYLARRRAQATLLMAFAVVVIGYLWPWAVRDAGLGLFSAHNGAMNAGAEGLLFLALLSAAAWSVIRAGMVGQWRCLRAPQGMVRREFTAQSGLLYILQPWATCGGIYLISLLLGGEAPISAASGRVVAGVVGIVGAAIVLNYGLRRLFGSVGWIGCLVTPLAIWGPGQLESLITMSPLAGIFATCAGSGFALSVALQRSQQQLTPIRWIVPEALCGIVLWLVSLGLDALSQRKRSSSDQAADGGTTLDPTKLGREVFGDADRQRQDTVAQTDSALSMALVRVIGRVVDNALLIKELRARFRNRLNTQKVLGGALALSLVCAAIAAFAPSAATPGMVFEVGKVNMGNVTTPVGIACDLVGCFYWAMIISAGLSGYAALPRSFGLDRRKNTLGFLLLTPMSSWSMVAGKVASVVLTGGVVLWISMAASFVLGIIAMMLGGGANIINQWLLMSSGSFLLYVSTTALMLALGSMFPNLTAIRLNGCIRLLVIWMAVCAASMIFGVFALIANYLNLGENGTRTVAYGIGVLVIGLSLLLTQGVVSGLRKGDIDIKLAKK